MIKSQNAAAVSGSDRLCDRCADRRIAARTSWPELPDPPAPLVVVGPDGRSHTMLIRLRRVPSGVVAEAVEAGPGPGEGYHLQVLGAHDVDVPMLVEQLRVQVREEIGTAYLQPSTHRAGWLLRGGQVRGRLVLAGDDVSYAVVVDGRTLSWEEFGRPWSRSRAGGSGWWSRTPTTSGRRPRCDARVMEERGRLRAGSIPGSCRAVRDSSERDWSQRPL